MSKTYEEIDRAKNADRYEIEVPEVIVDFETSRKMASIQVVEELRDIEGADKIQMARVLGWELVVLKGEFAVGDLCVYCEVDSILPESNPVFEFLKGKRIKTVKLRGQISQGICFPLSVLPKAEPPYPGIGSDVTERLGITKWAPEETPTGVKGNRRVSTFPPFIPRTDETRVQVLQHLLNRYEGTICQVTEKLDGSSITIYVQGGEFRVASRNFVVDDGTFYEQALVYKDKILAFANDLGCDLAVQGELVGPGVQKNKLKLTELQIRFFSLFDITNQVYIDNDFTYDKFVYYELPTVPVLDPWYILGTSIPALVKMSQGRSVIGPGPREGIVVRSMYNIEAPSRNMFSGGRAENAFGTLSFKVINPDFSLKYEG